MRTANVTLDTREFDKGLKTYFNSQHPREVAESFRDIAMDARQAVKQRTAEAYELHSEFIPNAILSTPFKDTQVEAAARGYAKHKDLEAAVFLRGSSSPRSSLGFMVNHETGDPKTPVDGVLAIPAEGIAAYGYRGSRGGVKAAYKPGALLDRYDEVKPGQAARIKGKKARKNKRGEAFVMKTTKGAMVVRRKSRDKNSLEFLYSFNDSAKIKADWGFESTIQADVKASYRKHLAKHINKTK